MISHKVQASMAMMGLLSSPAISSEIPLRHPMTSKFLSRCLHIQCCSPSRKHNGVRIWKVASVGHQRKMFSQKVTHICFSSASPSRRRTPSHTTTTDSAEPSTSAPWKFEFPHLAPAARAMMDELLHIVEKELGGDLLPTETDPNVQNFQTPKGNSHGSVVLRAGRNRDFVDRMLLSWLHCELPFGTLDFATLIILMGPSTDAPHILFEFPILQGTKITVVIDLLPRKDLAADVEYLDRIYGNTALAQLHKQCEQDSRMKRYVPPSLYIRSATSPTALLYALDSREWPQKGEGSIQNASENKNNFDDVIKDVVHPLARQALLTWIKVVRGAKTIPEGEERIRLAVRDDILLRNGIEYDLISKLPRLFGEDVTKVVVQALRDAR